MGTVLIHGDHTSFWLILDEITQEKVHCNFPAKCSTNVRPLDWWTDTFQFLAELLAQNRILEVNEPRSYKLLGLYCPLVVAKKRAGFLASRVLLGLTGGTRGRLGKRGKFKVAAPRGFSFSPKDTHYSQTCFRLHSPLQKGCTLNFLSSLFSRCSTSPMVVHPNPKSLSDPLKSCLFQKATLKHTSQALPHSFFKLLQNSQT